MALVLTCFDRPNLSGTRSSSYQTFDWETGVVALLANDPFQPHQAYSTWPVYATLDFLSARSRLPQALCSVQDYDTDLSGRVVKHWNWDREVRGSIPAEGS